MLPAFNVIKSILDDASRSHDNKEQTIIDSVNSREDLDLEQLFSDILTKYSRAH